MADELGDAELLDPIPDIHDLFSHYNTIYFSGALGPCIVSWSSKRMTSCAGICKYLQDGGCEIRLSEPLLKFRSTGDMKNTLLHEMIHAYLWIQDNDKNHSEHGSAFQRLMNAINSSPLIDYQRPSGGYNITIYHEFHDEVNNYRVHHWHCGSCGDLIKRAINREPSASDCIENLGHATSCGDSSCHWHRHKMSCSGSYIKIAEPPGYKDKRRVTKGMKEQEKMPTGSSYMTRHATKRSNKAEEKKDDRDVKKLKMITNFFPFVGDSDQNIARESSHCGEDWNGEVECKQLMAIDFKPHNETLVAEVPKRSRTQSSRKKRDFSCTKMKRSVKYKDQCPVISLWLDYYAEEETDDEIEPLINKRTERRKRQKLLEYGKGKAPKIEEMDYVCASHASDIIDISDG